MKEKTPLLALNQWILGAFLGFILSQILWIPLKMLVSIFEIQEKQQAILYLLLTLPVTYLTIKTIIRGSNEWSLSIPFIHFKEEEHNPKTILLDPSALADPRMIDLATSGILDDQLMLSQEVQNEWLCLQEEGDEADRGKARKALEVVKKLETLSSLRIKKTKEPLPEGKELTTRLLKFAKVKGFYLLTADTNPLQQAFYEGVKVINIHTLSNALKPITQCGETLEIKIQRYGKEPRQGVGYLEDGTMVVVNGAAEFIGESVKASVLSVKHTSSGRMVFCNCLEEGVSFQSLHVTFPEKINTSC